MFDLTNVGKIQRDDYGQTAKNLQFHGAEASKDSHVPNDLDRAVKRIAEAQGYVP